MKKLSAILAVLFVICSTVTAKPLKVYLLAGQSNMQGHAHVKTFEHIAMDPKMAPMLKKMTNEDGSPKTFDNIWITTAGVQKTETHGKMEAKYGGDRRGPKIGPEYTFSIYMQEHVKEPILIIKTAWGGKTLSCDFRPPSAGPYTAGDINAKNAMKVQADRRKTQGHYYRLMMTHAKKVLADIKTYYPDYDEKQGYEIAGFGWFQGASDFGDFTTYPNAGKPGGYDEYSRLLACLIKDVRKELSAPKMPAVIGVLGIAGDMSKDDPEYDMLISFRDAMAAPAKMPEFKGTVAAVRTEKYWEPQLAELQARWPKIKAGNKALKKRKLPRDQYDAELKKVIASVYSDEEWHLMEIGCSNAAYHYLGSAKILARVGKGMAEGLIGLEKSKKSCCSSGCK